MFPRSNIAISGGNFSHNEFRVETAFEKLQKASATSAFHNSSARFDPPKCHPNTRVAILEYLMGWIFGCNDPEARILWLYGPAGAGKSAILQTIAERCFEHNVLLASFFFSRSDTSRNTFHPLVATIAYQIATTLPQIKPLLESIIEKDSLIFGKSIAVQVQSLVVEPLKDLAASGFFNNLSACARLVLIDGLDECDDPRMQDAILRALANAFRSEKFPIIFLIASRPEQSITFTFNSASLTGLWRSLVLDDSFRPDDDIHLFLTDSFKEINATHPHRNLIPDAWPAQSDIDKLVIKSSGQFIYASVVVKYVSGHDARPPHRLEVVMGLRPARRDVPFAELDALYMHILGSCTDPDSILQILGPVISQLTRRVHDIEILLDLEPGDVGVALAPLYSLLAVKELTSLGDEITLYHASFSDFLVDISRSSQFHIDTLIVKQNSFFTCTRKLMYSPPTTGTIPPQTSTWRFLSSLSKILTLSLDNLPLTETVETALMEFSLPHIWTSWSRGPDIENGLVDKERLNIVVHFLDALKSRLDFPKCYKFHLSSFEPLLKSEITKYYKDAPLMSLVALSIMDSPTKDHFIGMLQGSGYDETFRTLFGMTEELMLQFDDSSLSLAQIGGGDFLLRNHYYHLFTGPSQSAEVCLDGARHAQIALYILEFLCASPPRPIPYYKSPRRKIPRTISEYGGTLSQHPKLQRRRTVQGNRLLITHTRHGASRKWREERHRYGVALSLPDTEVRTRDDDGTEWQEIPCEFGLRLLPEILAKSSKSLDLVGGIRRLGRRIAYIPNQTQRAIRAMHDYLDRTEDGTLSKHTQHI